VTGADRWPVALLAAAVVGACHPRGIPVLAAGLAVAAAFVLRRWLLLVVAVGALASGLGHRALAGLDGIAEQDVAASVTLLTDPRWSLGGSLRAEARVDGRRVELRARGVVAEELAPRLAGEVVAVRGTVGPLARSSSWTRSRHLAGTLRVLRVEHWSRGHPVAELANGLRRTLVAGAAPMGPTERSLLTGLVIGDDRAQPLVLADDFQGAGLTHLLAVSGQNVAFVLALAAPVLRRLRLWPRLLLALALIGLFATVTRFEPSVLRASVMAVVALVVTTLGSPTTRVRVLALALTGLLLVDPLLVRSVGFQLSAAATAAIVILAGPLEAALPGPPWLRTPLAVTAAAQLGVAPVLVTTFGPMPVASLPANLLAVPAAGLVMAWGLTAGLLAGWLVGVGAPGASFLAAALHQPTRLLLAWVAEVASRSAALPLGHLSGFHLLVLAAASAVLLRARWVRSTPRQTAAAADQGAGRPDRVRSVALLAGAMALLAAVVSAQASPGLRQDLLPGVVRWYASGTEVLVLGGVGGRVAIAGDALVARLREEDVDAIELLVLADAHVPRSLVAVIAERHPLGVVVAHGEPARTEVSAGGQIAFVRSPVRPETVRIHGLEVVLTPTTDRLVVDARRAG
jgi:competence protein ComEC